MIDSVSEKRFARAIAWRVESLGVPLLRDVDHEYGKQRYDWKIESVRDMGST